MRKHTIPPPTVLILSLVFGILSIVFFCFYFETPHLWQIFAGAAVLMAFCYGITDGTPHLKRDILWIRKKLSTANGYRSLTKIFMGMAAFCALTFFVCTEYLPSFVQTTNFFLIAAMVFFTLCFSAGMTATRLSKWEEPKMVKDSGENELMREVLDPRPDFVSDHH